MKEILLTSSVLILALLLLRRVFREKISRRMQYALWGLVLLRLLVPGHLPAADFSVLSIFQPVRAQVEERLEQEPVYVLPVARMEFSAVKPQDPTVILPLEGRYTDVSERGDAVFLTRYAFTLEEAWDLAWKTGIGVMGLWLIGSNLNFWRKLRKSRIPLELPECKYPVYLVEEGLVSPCLFGLFRPAVYLTPAAMESEDGLRHVLAHEQTHARHGDPLWSLLRGVCLAVYWFDPLVWWAAAASREDCELACDEGALKRLGETERIPYGQTLLRLIRLKRAAGGVLLTATTMTSDKKRIKARITRIAENRKMKTTALCAVLAVTTAVCAVTFTGCAAAEEPGELSGPATPVNAVEPVLPVRTIPLTNLSPYEPVRVEPISADTLDTGHHAEDHREDHHDGYQRRSRVGDTYQTAEVYTTFAWSCGGYIYMSTQHIARSAFPVDYFLCFPEQEYREEPFTGLFGYDGVKISYGVELETGACTVNDYYTFEDNGDSVTVFLLARTYGRSEAADIDGDGELELLAADGFQNCQLIFRRGGQLYAADVNGLVHENWPELTGLATEFAWDAEKKCLYMQGVLTDGTRVGRQIFFDGENLLL